MNGDSERLTGSLRAMLGMACFVVIIAGWVLGPVGMVLSVLLTMVDMIAMETHEDTRWLSVLLGSGETGKSD
jgi:predicted PurR-regulated permease PerM